MSAPTVPPLPSAPPTLRRRVVAGAAGGLLVLVLGAGALVGAWSATPPPAAPTAPGMITLLGRGLPAAAPGDALLLQRVSNQPGDVVLPHIHPGAETFYVESGTYGYTDLQGAAYVTRGIGATPTASHAASTPPPAETVPVGTEILLQAGDSLFQDRGVVHTIRVVGDAPASLLLARLFATDQPGITFTNAAGTPVP
jgi:quercetin dioxygenase-like cupin family protein